MNDELKALVSEKPNPASASIDSLSPIELLRVINEEDKKVALAVERALPEIAAAVSIIIDVFSQGGRLLYVGAGTSGRLGVLDAAECPPTFSTPPDMVVGIIAGGERALRHAVEGCEDSAEQGATDLAAARLTAQDAVVGIAASGRTPYVLGALQYAQTVGARALGLSCNPNARLREVAELVIEVVPGPEVISGSTRMKAGTAQKMVLNMLSTATMVLLGKTYKNYMVDVFPTNEKLRLRAVKMVSDLAGCDQQKAEQALQEASWHVKTAIVMCKDNVGYEEAITALALSGGKISLTKVQGVQG